MNKLLSCMAFAASILVVTSASRADVYKWKDAQGRLHYSDQQPVNIDNQRMKSSTGAPVTQPAVKSIGEKEVEFRKRQLEADEKAAKSDKELAEAKDREKNCNNARGNLKSLEGGIRLVKYNVKGEQVYVEDSERPALIEESKKAVASWCQ